MPEAAEVEIVRKGLADELIGQTLKLIEPENPKLGRIGDYQHIFGLEVRDVLRHGKWIGIQFEDGNLLRLHLRLAGRLLLNDSNVISRADLITMTFSDSIVKLQDPRLFATADIVTFEEFVQELGPDLLNDNCDLEKTKSRRAVKTFLLDQKVVAGIGNYLIDEALWQNKIHPETPAMSLSSDQLNQIVESARQVALNSLQAGGVSIKDYVDASGQPGTAQNDLQCYGRSGLPCQRCGSELKKIKVGGRGTTFCSSCQPVA
jgi:formamidopyrimidine-DNA glycosylase